MAERFTRLVCGQGHVSTCFGVFNSICPKYNLGHYGAQCRYVQLYNKIVLECHINLKSLVFASSLLISILGAFGKLMLNQVAKPTYV